MTKYFSSIQDKALISLLKNGAVGVIPTDTVYGIVCSAKGQDAVNRLYKLKSRDKKPGTIIAANIDQLVALGIKKRYLKAVEHFWPGPISIIIPTGLTLDYLHLGKQSLAIRIPDSKKISGLLERTGPLLTTSANTTEQPEATTIDEAEKYFEDKVDFYIDGGDLSGRSASTIIRVVDDAIEIIREGAVKLNENGRIEK